MYPFERFTAPAKRSLALAREEAERSRHSYIGAEHLLLGLLAVRNGTARRIVDEARIDPDVVRTRITEALGRGEEAWIRQIIPTSHVKRVIEIAFEQSARMDRAYVSTGELLLALVLEGEGIAAGVLNELGLEAEQVREKVAAAPPEGDEAAVANPPPQPARVLVHDPDPPHRLWEGSVLSVESGQFVIAVPDRPAGTEVRVGGHAIHPIPTGATFDCPYCQAHL